MNQIYIGQSAQFTNAPQTFNIQFEDADKYLQILRADYFSKVTISLPENILQKQLRFMMHFSRILKEKGEIYLLNTSQSNEYKTFYNLATKLGLHQNRNHQNQLFFSKQKIQNEKNEQIVEVKKTSIGFKPLETQEIDEEEMMKNESIDLQKPKAQNCAQKPRACANCNCGRKDTEQPVVPKQKLIESINEGKPVSGCGKCFLGDSFRCGTCPYKGLPAFKPGDKLKLMQEGQVIVQTNEFKVESGKVKIQL